MKVRARSGSVLYISRAIFSITGWSANSLSLDLHLLGADVLHHPAPVQVRPVADEVRRPSRRSCGRSGRGDPISIRRRHLEVARVERREHRRLRVVRREPRQAADPRRHVRARLQNRDVRALVHRNHPFDRRVARRRLVALRQRPAVRRAERARPAGPWSDRTPCPGRRRDGSPSRRGR